MKAKSRKEGQHARQALAAVVILAAGLVAGLAIHGGAVGTGGSAEAAPKKLDEVLNVTYRDGRLTVYCVNTTLDEVFQRVEATTGIPVVHENQSGRTCRSTTIKSQPLEWALDRLFTDHGFSYVLVLAPNNDIVTVRIFDTGEAVVQPAPPSPARRIFPRGPRRWPWFR